MLKLTRPFFAALVILMLLAAGARAGDSAGSTRRTVRVAAGSQRFDENVPRHDVSLRLGARGSLDVYFLVNRDRVVLVIPDTLRSRVTIRLLKRRLPEVWRMIYHDAAKRRYVLFFQTARPFAHIVDVRNVRGKPMALVADNAG